MGNPGSATAKRDPCCSYKEVYRCNNDLGSTQICLLLVASARLPET